MSNRHGHGQHTLTNSLAYSPSHASPLRSKNIQAIIEQESEPASSQEANIHQQIAKLQTQELMERIWQDEEEFGEPNLECSTLMES